MWSELCAGGEAGGDSELWDENQLALGLQGPEVQREGNSSRQTRPCRSIQIHPTCSPTIYSLI